MYPTFQTTFSTNCSKCLSILFKYTVPLLVFGLSTGTIAQDEVTFNSVTGTLSIPQLFAGEAGYSVELEYTSVAGAFVFVLSAAEELSSSSQSEHAAQFANNIAHVPFLYLDSVWYSLDLGLISDQPITFSLGNITVVDPPTWYDEEVVYIPENTEQELANFFASHGGVNAFGQQAVDAITTYLSVDELLRTNDLVGANNELSALWNQYPAGDSSWRTTPYIVNGAHIGAPSAYYGLRQLSDLVAHRLAGGGSGTPIHLTIVLAGCAEGVQATTLAELESGGGQQVRLDLDQRVLETDEVFGQATGAFTEYVEAMTQGGLNVITRVAHLPQACVPIETRATPPYRYAHVTSLTPLWDAMPAAITEQTDWWWVLYPSAVPEQHSELKDLEFIAGGMATHPDGAPVFLSDDRWVLRIPPHLGSGDWSNIERRTYFPQWLMHELFHFLFALYPEFELEVESHQWFDRTTWPGDFSGRYEADYYVEALHKRLWDASPTLTNKLRFKPPSPALFGGIDVASLVGSYQRIPVENSWHQGEISYENDTLRWTNMAGVSWGLGYAGGSVILTDEDNPYDNDFIIALARDPDSGEYTSEVIGFRFNSELYARQ